ncbi:helix-turn-helix domain-containing protein [Nonomuraea glycinis]|uniref:helix-turn-helix domain-containing protein n=1 Tax=Nonomuraea glycinis TaxID=2047744 RepID=UPI0033B072BB
MSARPHHPMTSPDPCPVCAGHWPGDTSDLVCQCGTTCWPTTIPEEISMSTDDRNARILAMYVKPEILLKDIAATFGLTSARITQIARAAQVPLRRPQNRPKGINRGKVIEDHQNGISVTQIAVRHGVTESTIRHHLDQVATAA